MDIKETHLFSTPVWEVENKISDAELKLLVEFAYEAVSKWPLNNPVSKRHGQNSKPLSFNNPLLMKILSESLELVKDAYQPSVKLFLEKYWININPPGSYNVRHTHPRSVLACTLYLKTPTDSGDLVLYNTNPAQVFSCYSNNPAQYNYTEWRIRPQPGLFVACPGWLDHSVDPNLSNSDRISISMNIVTHE
jgi:uncharacterized protein (TIGR02466 family)